MQELERRLFSLSFKLGFTFEKAPSKVEIIEISRFLKDNFSDFSVEEIIDSFELGISGKLGLDTNEIKHYQSFNIIYISIFLRAFRPYRERILKENPPKEDKPLQIPLSEAESKRIEIEGLKTRLIEHFNENVKRGNAKRFYGGNRIYDVLHSEGKIMLSTSLKEEIKAIARVKLKDNLEIEASGNELKFSKLVKSFEKKFLEKDKDLEAQINIEAKHIALDRWLNDLASMDEDLEQILNEK